MTYFILRLAIIIAVVAITPAQAAELIERYNDEFGIPQYVFDHKGERVTCAPIVYEGNLVKCRDQAGTTRHYLKTTPENGYIKDLVEA